MFPSNALPACFFIEVVDLDRVPTLSRLPVVNYIFVFPISFRNVTSHVPDPGGIAVVQTQACCWVFDSNYVHIPVVAGEQDFFVSPKGGVATPVNWHS